MLCKVMTELNRPRHDSFFQVRTMLCKAITMTRTQEAHKNDMPKRTRVAAWRRRWGIGLLAVSLLAIGAYVFLTRASQAPSRTAAPGPPPIPVVAVSAQARDMGVYLT